MLTATSAKKSAVRNAKAEGPRTLSPEEMGAVAGGNIGGCWEKPKTRPAG